MKPIEPGCLVLVIAGEEAGSQGVVARWLPRGVEAFGMTWKTNGWLVERGDECGVFEGQFLMRIDDYQQETTETEQEVTA